MMPFVEQAAPFADERLARRVAPTMILPTEFGDLRQ